MNGEQVCYIWCYRSHSLILVTGISTWHLMAKKLSEDLKKNSIALHKDGVGHKKIANTLKLSCSTMTKKTIQQFNRTDSTQKRPRQLSARAQCHIQWLCFGNRRMSAASIATEVEGVGVCQCSDHMPHTASNWSSQKEASTKDDAQESPQTVY